MPEEGNYKKTKVKRKIIFFLRKCS